MASLQFLHFVFLAYTHTWSVNPDVKKIRRSCETDSRVCGTRVTVTDVCDAQHTCVIVRICNCSTFIFTIDGRHANLNFGAYFAYILAICSLRHKNRPDFFRICNEALYIG